MINIEKISKLTSLMSFHYFLNEVPVEGRTTRKFHFNIGRLDLYAAQIIRAGNCCTLLSNPMSMTGENFWKPSHFDDFVRYVFWTFKENFLLQILERMQSLQLITLLRYRDLLDGRFTPYEGVPPEDADDELKYCWAKNASLKKSDRYTRMYWLDEHNRRMVLNELERKIRNAEWDFKMKLKSHTAMAGTDEFPVSDKPILSDDNPPKKAGFLDMLVPMEENPERTLQFIIEKTEEAGFKFPLFSPVGQLSGNKNPYKFNGCLAAMVDFFYQHGYFKKEFTLEQVFAAQLTYSGNKIGKFKTFLSEFRQDNSYKAHIAKLKALNIKNIR